MKVRLLALGLLTVLMTTIWSCGPGDNTVTIEVLPANEFPERGDEVAITVRADSEHEDLTEVTVVIKATDSTGTEIEVLNETKEASGLSFEEDFTMSTPNSVKIGEVLSIVVTAKDAESGSFEGTGSAEVVSYYKVYRADAVSGHRFGTQAIGYNLVDAIEVYGDAPANTKDMVDNSEQNKELSNVFISNTESGAQFVDLGNAYDISTLNTGIAAKRFAESQGSTLISVIAGTKFLAKLRDNSYTLVHIKEIDAEYSHQGATDNLGRYTMDIYKAKQ